MFRLGSTKDFEGNIRRDDALPGEIHGIVRREILETGG
nr:MAG TPA: hypothetical protein [Caudoviricetes sp.]